MRKSRRALVNNTAGLSGKCVRWPSSRLYHVQRLPKYLCPDLQGVRKAWWTSESHLGVEKMRVVCSEKDCVTVITVCVRDGEGIIYTSQRRKLGTKPGAQKPHVQVVFTEFTHEHVPAENKAHWRWKPRYWFPVPGSSQMTAVLCKGVLTPRGKNIQRTSGKRVAWSSFSLCCL